MFKNNENRRWLVIIVAFVVCLAVVGTARSQTGTVLSHQKISDTQGNFTGILDNDYFGFSVASLGDLDGDGVTDLAVGARKDDDGGTDRGAVWVLFLGACRYRLTGDMNYDCKVDFFDFAMMAANWLIDCDLTPSNPACVPR